MWNLIIAWRGEILIGSAWVATFYLMRKFRLPYFWKTWLAGTALGLCVEFMTEAEWAYHMQLYLWRDISPFIIAGWGIMFTWLIVISDWFRERVFHPGGSETRQSYFIILLCDLIIGVPLFLMNELSGINLLKLWDYTPLMHWDTMLPVIHYPLEGVIAIILYALVMPSLIRYWKGCK